MMYLAGAIYILKVAAWCGVAGLSVTLLNDKDIHKGVKKIKGLYGRMQKITHINLEDCHTVVFGMTRHGKTYAMKKTLNVVKEGVFFFNTQHEEMPKNFRDATGANSFEQIIDALERGQKINYLPALDKEKRQKELELIIRRLYDGEKRNIRFVVDESHLFKKSALNMLQEIATTGLRFGIKAVFITQRGALLDNTLISQSNKFVFFYTPNTDKEYFRGYGFPVEEIAEKINNEKYVFVTYDGKNLEGAYKIV